MHLLRHFLICELEHILISRSVTIALVYGKKLTLRFCEKVAKVILTPLLTPAERFLTNVSVALSYSLVIAALIGLASAIPRRS